MFVTVTVAVTLVPAVLAVGSRFGLFGAQAQDQRLSMAPGWHRHRPLARTHSGCRLCDRADGSPDAAGYKTSYNDRLYLPKNIPANVGYAAADRHFSQARMMPEILLLESDHDLRNPADFLILNRVAKAILKIQEFLGCRA